MSISLTPRQMDALRFIAGFVAAKGYAPSRSDMSEGMAINRSSAHWLLDGLVERGYVHRLACRERAIEVIEVPEVPRAPDGAPLYAVPGFWPSFGARN